MKSLIRYGFPFTLFQENGEVKTFTGNTDVNTIRKNSLPSVIYTRAIRFYPQSYNIRIALRVELYGYSPGKYIECYHIIIECSYYTFKIPLSTDKSPRIAYFYAILCDGRGISQRCRV